MAQRGPIEGARPRSAAGREGQRAPAPKRPRRSGGGGGGRSKGAKPRGLAGWLRFIAFGFIKLLLALSLGVTFGGTFVVWVLYKVAVVEVEGHLSRPVWAMTGRVYSAPIELWTGLQASPESVAHALQSAGYARVPTAERPGDFQISGDALKVKRPAAEGPGWQVKEATITLRFAEGRIRSIEPPGRVVFAPAELSSVRGSGNEARRPVPLAEVPVVVRQAVLAMEDARFYEHEGLDPVGIGRAIFNNVVLGRPMQGGSTLTQQVVKNLFLTVERTYERKAREALLSVALERVRTKDQILELYLNEIYLGQVAGASVCGVDQASRAYFGRPIERISLGEAATLAGIVSAPNRYSPLQHPEAALERRDLALSRMAEVGFIPADMAAAEQKRALELHPSAQKRQATWAVDAAIGRTEAELGEGSVAARGLSVYTDINPLLQSLAEAAVEAGGAELDAAHPRSAGAEIALVAVRVRDGAIVAMVGGRSYARSQFNRAVFGERQVGSTVKPITFLAAFEDDPTQSPATVVVDEPIERTVDGKLWAPQNYDGRYVGAVTWRRALDQSRNVPAVLVAEQVGLRRLDQLSDTLGLAAVEPYPSSALGAFGATPAALAGAYTVFPGGGLVARPRLVRAVRDAAGAQLWGEEGGVHRVVSGRAAFLATSMLRTVVTEGTAHSAAKYGAVGALGGKTGTTDELRDAWFVGFSETLVTAVWVGFDRGRDLGLTGGEAALPTWARFMAATGTAGRSFAAPDDVESVPICAESHQPVSPACPSPTTEWMSRGYTPAATCPLHGEAAPAAPPPEEAPTGGAAVKPEAEPKKPEPAKEAKKEAKKDAQKDAKKDAKKDATKKQGGDGAKKDAKKKQGGEGAQPTKRGGRQVEATAG